MNFLNRSSGNVFFWLLAPALIPLLVAPLVIGHVMVRLMIARMRRRRGQLQDATSKRAVAASTTRPTWRSPMLSTRS